ncbi:glucosamine-6-phosphate deaminase [Adlercreutzia sp. ZJ154]|uniref:glucosamine-6-phosphate deaminase n=1 Tax=Adlercreutzia sp. ZJ154 TaxID=2709790 RepID=UPI0013EC32BA|nr:glucosamine-6-phosphate deaminase [Adlercreutzia sp. ZJ154]
MNIIIADDYEKMSRIAADIIAEKVRNQPKCVLGLATGSTPIGTYENLVADCKAGKVDFSDVTTFNLDEYVGLQPENDQSYRYFMNTNLFDHVNIDKARTHVPDGSNPDAAAVCEPYDEAIASAGGIELQLLGLGHNGHIGFNEPADEFPVGTHIVDLTETTIQANSRLFDNADQVPRQAYTMGIGTIMGAREVLVVVSGEDKAETVALAFSGPVRPQVPASVLQLHPNCTIVLDKAAASAL